MPKLLVRINDARPFPGVIEGESVPMEIDYAWEYARKKSISLVDPVDNSALGMLFYLRNEIDIFIDLTENAALSPEVGWPIRQVIEHYLQPLPLPTAELLPSIIDLGAVRESTRCWISAYCDDRAQMP